ncbi:MAG: acetyl-CoA carboxylase biotin carboxyl carrier protein subunit [Bacteroidales bacterium]|jgi:pyruvate carboxylase|nr:acetyl-CoA carboxylase biotin carboxyl carrier protein subunit [Bacteroidales bacterium]MDD4214098.1 acetyl-CoA carboxylase biotin carboxyl carrier protein subunit [Bacteroidales bacterium]
MSKKKKLVKPELYILNVLGEDYSTTLTNKYKNRKPYSPYTHKHITSFIPGTIKKVFVEKGDEVISGQKLLILEAMKMDNEIITNISGKIKKVFVKSGQMVSKNELLIEIS